MKENNCLISIIIPVYNVECYLKKCLTSVIRQTYNNLEIIIIDDGSTDNSAMICDQFAKIDKRIKVFHKINEGLSSARNLGLKIASGKLICFVDSDDYISPKMLSRLKENMDKYDSDISICQYFKKYRFFKRKIGEINFESSFTFKEKFVKLEEGIIHVVVWNKLYKKEIFENILFPVGKLFEDNYSICTILDKANKISYLNEPLYYYRIRKSGICMNVSSKYSNLIESRDVFIDFYKKKKYFDLLIKSYYRKVRAIHLYLFKLRIKDFLNNKSNYMNEAIFISQMIKNNDNLSDNENKIVVSFLNNPYKYYKEYYKKEMIKETITRILCYK